MALARLLYRIVGDASGFEAAAGRAERSADGINVSLSRTAASATAIAAGISAAVAAMDSLIDRADELDRTSRRTGTGAQLLGEDRAAAIAVEAVGNLAGVGPREYFDASEAVADALTNRTGGALLSARQAAAGIGLDVDRFLSAETPFERGNLLLDALSGVEDHRLIAQAASELGSGDIRDFAELAGDLRLAPARFHPRNLAEQIRSARAHLTPEQARESVTASLERSVLDTISEEVLAGHEADSLILALSELPLIGDNYGRAVAQRALSGPADPDAGRRQLAEHFGTTLPEETRVVVSVDGAAADRGINAAVEGRGQRGTRSARVISSR